MPGFIALLQPNVQIAFQRGSVLWHNDAKGECMNMLWPSVNEIKRRRPCMIRRITLPAIGAILLLAAPAPRAQNAAQQGEKSEAAAAGNAETGKKIFTKAGCYECHGREGQGAAQASGPRIGPSQRFIRPFIKYVRQPTGQMPPYTSAVISRTLQQGRHGIHPRCRRRGRCRCRPGSEE